MTFWHGASWPVIILSLFLTPRRKGSSAQRIARFFRNVDLPETLKTVRENYGFLVFLKFRVSRGWMGVWKSLLLRLFCKSWGVLENRCIHSRVLMPQLLFNLDGCCMYTYPSSSWFIYQEASWCGISARLVLTLSGSFKSFLEVPGPLRVQYRRM